MTFIDLLIINCVSKEKFKIIVPPTKVGNIGAIYAWSLNLNFDQCYRVDIRLRVQGDKQPRVGGTNLEISVFISVVGGRGCRLSNQ